MTMPTLDSPIRLTCAHCQQHFRVRARSVLRPGAKSTCAGCGTKFHVLARPAVPERAEGRSEYQAEHPSEPEPQAAHREQPGSPSSSLSSSEQPSKTSKGALPIHRARFFGQGGSLFGIHVVNVCLTLVTLSVYSFWAKVRVRQYLYSHTQFSGDRFAYHGTGRELLNGASKATFVFGLPYLLLSNLPLLVDGGQPFMWATQILSTLLALLFLPVAIVGARRYRLSRSSWRGLRFSFRGATTAFLRVFLGGAVLTAFTLGAYYPIFDLKQQAFLLNQTYFGNRRFSYEGDDWALAMNFACAVVLLPFTFGLSWFWYSAARQRYIWNHTKYGDARFTCTMQGWPLAKLRLGNFVLLLCSLGLAWPWTAVRNAAFLMKTVTLTGPVDFEHIAQDAQSASTTGEGLSGWLDSGFDLG